MLKNHIKSILRGLGRSKAYALINITGLAIGFAAAALISIYVYQEFTYDRYYKEHERIYRLSAATFAMSSIAHLTQLKNEVAGVEAVVNIMPNPSGTLKLDEKSFIEKQVFYSTAEYLTVFEQPFVYGNPATAFEAPNSLLLSESMARKVFGDANPVGETLTLSTQISDDQYLVTGVIKDLPENVHLKWEVLARTPQEFVDRIKENFGFTTGYSYFKTASPMAAASIQEQSDLVFGRRFHEQWGQGQSFEAFLADARGKFLPLVLNIADVHLGSDLQFEAEPAGKANYLYIFMGIALFIILLAAINYVNLATAQASKKAKEVGVRKVLGSVKSHLVSRFLTESVMLTLFAVIIGLGLAEASLVLLRQLGFTSFNTNVYDFPQLVLLILGIAFITGIVAGIYPAFYLTSFRPSAVLKGNYKGGQSKWFRNSLVLFQYVVSLTLAVFSIFIYKQLNYGLEKDLGFNKENVLVIDNAKSQLGAEDENTEPFRNALLQHPAVQDVSYSFYSMVNQLPSGSIFEIGKEAEEDYLRVQYKYTDHRFLSTMGFELLEGRDFDPERDNSREAMIINETLAKKLGGEVLGRRFNAGVNGESVEIVGVVADYHYEDMGSAIGPTTFYYRSYPSQVSVRISGRQTAQTLAAIQRIYAQFSNEPLDYYFFDKQFDQLFNREKRLGRIVTIFTGLAIFVALLGLIGLVSYKLDQRIKEIGIRKVLGARVRQIIGLFSKELTWLVCIAFLVTIPLGVYITSNWLNSFAYHVEIQSLPFVLVGIISLGITLAIVAIRTLKTAFMNPVNALRNE